MKYIEALIVNAFPKNNAGGSPTGVVLNATGLNDLQMQSIAKQLDTSHTAFAFEEVTDKTGVSVRFFTRNNEILNCGHGTIAMHYARAKHLQLDGNLSLNQNIKEGIQPIQIIKEGNEFVIYLQQNEIRFTTVTEECITKILKALKIQADDLAIEMPVILASPGSNRFLVGVKSNKVLRKIEPDFEQLTQVCKEQNPIGCFIYCLDETDEKFAATARMFAPSIGVNEDIINGNSSGCLGEYLLRMNGNEHLALSVYQGQQFNQEGEVKVMVSKMNDRYHTVIGGTAVITKKLLLELHTDYP
ncbi:MAG: PhzF family phenazine biosynthesis isomerase [Chitinophagaceae bacterium]|nr:PhzF family phenazine biosynthesis isomerase [Chitinophagaceae bacterium]